MRLGLYSLSLLTWRASEAWSCLLTTFLSISKYSKPSINEHPSKRIIASNRTGSVGTGPFPIQSVLSKRTMRYSINRTRISLELFGKAVNCHYNRTNVRLEGPIRSATAGFNEINPKWFVLTSPKRTFVRLYWIYYKPNNCSLFEFQIIALTEQWSWLPRPVRLSRVYCMFKFEDDWIGASLTS